MSAFRTGYGYPGTGSSTVLYNAQELGHRTVADSPSQGTNTIDPFLTVRRQPRAACRLQRAPPRACAFEQVKRAKRENEEQRWR